MQIKCWHYTAWFLSSCLVVPLVLNALKLTQCVWLDGESFLLADLETRYACFELGTTTALLTMAIVFYVDTVQAVIPQLFSRAIMKKEDGVDIRFRIGFSGMWQQLALYCVIYVGIFTLHSEHAIALGCALCVVMFVWALCFPFMSLSRSTRRSCRRSTSLTAMCLPFTMWVVRTHGEQVGANGECALIFSRSDFEHNVHAWITK